MGDLKPILLGLALGPLMAACSWGRSLDSVAARLAKGATHLQNPKVAVMLFTYPDGAISTGSSLVAETLTTQLVGRKHISVIERSQLSKVLAEEKLELSGVIASSGTQTLGKILGADAIVTGTLVDLPEDRTRVHARMISTATGEVLAAAETDIDRTWDDSPHQPVTFKDKEAPETHAMSALIPVSQGHYHPRGGPSYSDGPPPPPPRHHRF
jgi:TolB-like protein